MYMYIHITQFCTSDVIYIYYDVSVEEIAINTKHMYSLNPSPGTDLMNGMRMSKTAREATHSCIHSHTITCAHV